MIAAAPLGGNVRVGERTRGWRGLPAVVSAVMALVVVGPALGPGVAIAYDMAWSPDPRLTPFVLGLDTPAPRAVPSDAVAVMFGKALGASLAQDVILIAIFIAAALGAVRMLIELLPNASLVARCVAATAAVWNPFVSERLAVGQWAVLLGYAVLPWGLAATLGLVRGRPGGRLIAGCIAVAACGGANALVIVSGSMLVVLGAGALRARRVALLRPAAVVTLVTVGGGAAWALPALRSGATTSPEGVHAFVPTSDSPLGVLGSLLGGGGFWNVAAHPEPRQHLLIALVGAILTTLGAVAALFLTEVRVRWVLAVLLGVAWVVLLISSLDVMRPVWVAVLTELPGGALLRDSHKLVAPWVMIGGIGLGVATDWVRVRSGQWWAGPVTVLLVALPVLVSPQLVWGLNGRIAAVTVPSDFRSAAEAIAKLPPGDVGLLPWNQYRRYEWNAARVSLTLAPRMVDRVVLFDDSLPLRSGVIRGENSRASAVSARIAGGMSSEEAVARSGVRYVMVERRAGQDVDEHALQGYGAVRLSTPHVLVVDVGGADDTHVQGARVVVVGWAVTLLTALWVLTWLAWPKMRRMLPAGLLRSGA